MDYIDFWKTPTQMDAFPEDSELVLFIDENGDSVLSPIIKNVKNNIKLDDSNRYFNLIGVLMTKDDFLSIKESFRIFKDKYWPNGVFTYKGNKTKKVCLHSYEIRRKTGPFSKNVIKNYNEFYSDLDELILKCPIKIIDVFIDKLNYYKKYKDNSQNPYNVAIQYILERVLSDLYNNPNLTLLFESRGKKEDSIVLDSLNLLKKQGTYYMKSHHFKKIKYVSFNPKRPKENQLISYFGLEIADLCAYPIFNYCKTNIKSNSFIIVETKFRNYPNYKGKGLKIFP